MVRGSKEWSAKKDMSYGSLPSIPERTTDNRSVGRRGPYQNLSSSVALGKTPTHDGTRPNKYGVVRDKPVNDKVAAVINTSPYAKEL